MFVKKYTRCSNQTGYIFHARESESSLPRATDTADEGSKNGLRSDLRASNLKNFPLGAKDPLAPACFRAQSRIQPDQFNFASAGPVLMPWVQG